MNPTLKRILILLGVAGAVFGPAYNVTTEELKDLYDDSATTRYQPDVMIDAWMGAARDAVLAVFLFLNRNSLLDDKPKP